MLKFTLPGKLSWNKSGVTSQAVRMEREDHVDPSLAPDLGFVFPKWMETSTKPAFSACRSLRW